MSIEGIAKGAAAGAGVALLMMYLYKRKQNTTGKLAQAADDIGLLKGMSMEKLAELKDNIEDILAEREGSK